jgi:hypothetical protein
MAADGGDPRCARYGRGFVYSEGSGFCVKVSGSVETSARFGKGPFNDDHQHGWDTGDGLGTEVEGSLDARKDTDLGPLRVYVQPKGKIGQGL